MDLANLKYAEGSKKNRKRVGRGGVHGKTSCRGYNGQGARRGSGSRLWFEGGQMPIIRRIPKRGFFSFTRKDVQIVNLCDLANVSAEEITAAVLVKSGLIKSADVPVKVLGNGEITKKLTITANAFSKSAIEKIEAAGGRATIL